MITIKRLVLEVHRRSLWQVLGIYLVGSWITLQVVQALTVSAGLPDWVPGFALVLLLIGLPIVMATAFVQEGGPVSSSRAEADASRGGRAADVDGGASLEALAARHATPAAAAPDGPARSAQSHAGPAALPHRLFTWRNALTGGVAAFALLGVSVAAFSGMRALGIGPVATLRAQGVFAEGERVIMADFVNATSDPLLSDVVTTALRVDLHQSQALVLLEPTEIARVLQRMQRSAANGLDAATALEIAEREGIKAVLEGEVGALGNGYVVSATLRGVNDGRSLAAFRVTARSADDLIPAVDQLSRQIREKSGESLRTIRSGQPLVQVTTPSIEALRKFTAADALAREGDRESALPLLEEAVALDTAFAMAWRSLGIIRNNLRVDPAGEADAYTRAYRHSDRLTERERYLAAASYHSFVTRDRDQTMQAYQSMLRLNPEDGTALNNLANVYAQVEQYAEAQRLYSRAVKAAGRNVSAHVNLVFNALALSRPEEAREALAAYEREFPNDPQTLDATIWLAWAEDDLDRAQMLAERMRDSLQLPPLTRGFASGYLSLFTAERGQYRRSVSHHASFSQALEAFSPGGSAGAQLFAVERDALLDADRPRLLARADSVAASEAWRATPPGVRGYEDLLTAYAALGAGDRFRQHLAEWEASVPASMRGSDYPRNRLALLGILALREGNAAEAAEQIEAARTLSGCRRCFRPYLAEAYERLGRIDDAIALHESSISELHGFPPRALMDRLIAVERLGPLYEARGDRELAIQAYARFIERWSDADRELQPRVETARRALERMRGPG
jgi:eukaryotic-like serine/threonine-protein kinase